MTESLMTIEDELLVMAIQDGRAEALDLLVERWNRRLWLHAYRMTGDTDGSWEVLQESWIGIIKGIQRLRDASAYKGWMYRIVSYKAMDWLKKKPKKDVQIDFNEIVALEKDKQDHPDIYHLIEGLDAKKRAVVVLFYFEELGIQNISNVLKIPVGTVKSRLSKAREELKHQLEMKGD